MVSNQSRIDRKLHNQFNSMQCNFYLSIPRLEFKAIITKEGRQLVRKGFFGVGKWKKDRISKLKTFLTKAISQYTFKMHLKAIQKSNNKVI